MSADGEEQDVRAAIATRPGGPDVLRLVERDEPRPGPRDLLVRVHATAVNRADVLQRRGLYPPPPDASAVLGLELAGEVAAMGAQVRGWAEGDRVCAIVAAGGNAEWAVVPADTALPVPKTLDLVQAAAIPEAFTTAWDNLVNRGRAQSGQTVLVHGGSSGVGTAAIQILVRAGCRVFVTASSQGKLDACAELGAVAGIDYKREDFVARVRELTAGAGVDVILDIVGGDYLDRNLRALALEGRLVIIGLQGGRAAEADLGRLLTRRLTVTASTLRSRSLAEKAALAGEMRAAVLPGFVDGSLRPVIDTVLPLSRIAEAHKRMESSAHIGKIVLRVRD